MIIKNVYYHYLLKPVVKYTLLITLHNFINLFNLNQCLLSQYLDLPIDIFSDCLQSNNLHPYLSF